jgi:uncharacterized protein YlxW (UPF0749 family)
MTAPAKDKRPANVTMALLEDLLTNTLDPGYRAAASKQRTRHRWEHPLVWLCCVAVGLLLTVAYQQTHRAAPAREVARQDLISRIHSLQSVGNRLDDNAKQLAGDVARLRDQQLANAGSQDLRDLEVASGTVAVTGPGMVVSLAEPKAPDPSAGNNRPGTTPQTDVAVLHDTDIRTVVNQLWTAGAEAIAVNGIRLTTTSAIRFAGEAVLVDFQQINSPYTIEAIGPRDQLLTSFADSPIARQLKTKEAVYDITFKFNGKSDLRLESVTVSQPRYAQAGSAAPSPSTSESPR